MIALVVLAIVPVVACTEVWSVGNFEVTPVLVDEVVSGMAAVDVSIVPAVISVFCCVVASEVFAEEVSVAASVVVVAVVVDVVNSLVKAAVVSVICSVVGSGVAAVDTYEDILVVEAVDVSAVGAVVASVVFTDLASEDNIFVA